MHYKDTPKPTDRNYAGLTLFLVGMSIIVISVGVFILTAPFVPAEKMPGAIIFNPTFATSIIIGVTFILLAAFRHFAADYERKYEIAVADLKAFGAKGAKELP